MLNAIPSTFVHGSTPPLQEQTNLQVAVHQARTNNAEQLETRFVPGATPPQAQQSSQKDAVVWQPKPRQRDVNDPPRRQHRDPASQSSPPDPEVDVPADEVAVLASPLFAGRRLIRNVPAALSQYRKNTRQGDSEETANERAKFVNIRA
ncbi:MAG: hypothetical protein HQL63_08760 [Magnetococcales bacterium]|nr:hypothetical protein [Magnetococcales bacterium]MBF0323234.1 hypothetical protein [Magnetococcales bacterium]